MRCTYSKDYFWLCPPKRIWTPTLKTTSSNSTNKDSDDFSSWLVAILLLSTRWRGCHACFAKFVNKKTIFFFQIWYESRFNCDNSIDNNNLDISHSYVFSLMCWDLWPPMLCAWALEWSPLWEYVGTWTTYFYNHSHIVGNSWSHIGYAYNCVRIWNQGKSSCCMGTLNEIIWLASMVSRSK